MDVNATMFATALTEARHLSSPESGQSSLRPPNQFN